MNPWIPGQAEDDGMVLMLFGALFTGLFIAGEYANVNRIETPHMVSMQVFTASALLLWAVLRGHKQWFRRVA